MKYSNQIMIRGKHILIVRGTVAVLNTQICLGQYGVTHLFLAINFTPTYIIPEKNVEIFNSRYCRWRNLLQSEFRFTCVHRGVFKVAVSAVCFGEVLFRSVSNVQ